MPHEIDAFLVLDAAVIIDALKADLEDSSIVVLVQAVLGRHQLLVSSSTHMLSGFN